MKISLFVTEWVGHTADSMRTEINLGYKAKVVGKGDTSLVSPKPNATLFLTSKWGIEKYEGLDELLAKQIVDDLKEIFVEPRRLCLGNEARVKVSPIRAYFS